MTCMQVRQLLDWFADGELDPREQAAVRTHLESCKGCSEELSVVRAGIKLARSLPEDAPPADLRSKILAAAASRSKGSAGVRWTSWPARAVIGLSFAAAAAAVVFTVVLPGLRARAPVGTAGPSLAAKAVAPEPGTRGVIEAYELASGSSAIVEPIRPAPARRQSGRHEVAPPAGPTEEPAGPSSEPAPPAEEPEVALRDIEWPEGAEEMPVDDVVFGPRLPTVDDLIATAPVGEATRIAMERSIDSDLIEELPEGELRETMVSARFDAEELTADLIKAINERLASAKPMKPVRALRLEQGRRGGVAVPVMHGRFK